MRFKAATRLVYVGESVADVWRVDTAHDVSDSVGTT